MRILDLFKRDLKETRDKMAADLRRFRQIDRLKARILLRRWRAGMNATEQALQDNLYGRSPTPNDPHDVQYEEGLRLLVLPIPRAILN